jgi:type IV pilus assembly protein PilE
VTPHPTTSARRRRAGFTLIELMIAIAILGILTAVALPAYQQHLRTSTRAEAQAYMMAVATRQQQFLVDTRGYVDPAQAGVAVPAKLAAAYETEWEAPEGGMPSFTLTLAPKGAQEKDKCGTLSISHTGAKTAAAAGCW